MIAKRMTAPESVTMTACLPGGTLTGIGITGEGAAVGATAAAGARTAPVTESGIVIVTGREIETGTAIGIGAGAGPAAEVVPGARAGLEVEVNNMSSVKLLLFLMKHNVLNSHLFGIHF